jgi:uncharacterized protein YbaR (Trm112 family)
MIINDKLDRALNHRLLKRICCPVCLSTLFHSFVDDKDGRLACYSCSSTYIIVDRLPILLIDDENRKKKRDEIEGEVVYNVKTIPQKVHVERNAFVDNNTEMFLKEADIDLSNDDVLIVGCSFSELNYFYPRCKNVFSLDIVPHLVKDCLRATLESNIPADWICADGECLPFDEESFDTVIVRQTLHHMLKYYSAICEFFRVCKRGGNVLLIDEPYMQAVPNDSSLSNLPDGFQVYDGLEFKSIREKLKIPKPSQSEQTDQFDLKQIEKSSMYIQPDRDNPESYLADKYHSFSVINCINALRLHTDNFQLVWPRETAWTDEPFNVVRFCHGPNPNYGKPLIDRLINSGNLSVAAKKEARTSVLRDRSSLRSLPTEIASEMA